jgi:hypothetical protein
VAGRVVWTPAPGTAAGWSRLSVSRPRPPVKEHGRGLFRRREGSASAPEVSRRVRSRGSPRRCHRTRHSHRADARTASARSGSRRPRRIRCSLLSAPGHGRRCGRRRAGGRTPRATRVSAEQKRPGWKRQPGRFFNCGCALVNAERASFHSTRWMTVANATLWRAVNAAQVVEPFYGSATSAHPATSTPSPSASAPEGAFSWGVRVLFGPGRFGRMRTSPSRRWSSSHPCGRAIRRSGRRGHRAGGIWPTVARPCSPARLRISRGTARSSSPIGNRRHPHRRRGLCHPVMPG